MAIIEIPFGILIITLIVILFIFKKAYKEQKKLINNIICILHLILITSIIFVLMNGFGYPCPCGCGSEEIDWGIKAIISLFTKNSSYILIDTFPYSTIMITTSTTAAFTIIKAIEYKLKKDV